MARLRQKYPGNYHSSSPISAEFEGIIRYINAVENAHGNLTIGELMAKLFDSEGNFDGPIDFRFDGSTGIEYRIGDYEEGEDDDGWELLVPIEDLRGTAGQNVGTVEGAIFYNRSDVTLDPAQTDIPYAVDTEGEDVLLWLDGVLQADSTYTWDGTEVVLGTPATGGEIATLITVRDNVSTNYRRIDIVAVAAQTVFPFVHTDNEEFLVYQNGVLLREGALYDFVHSAGSSSLTLMNPALLNDLISIIVIEDTSQTNVVGLMMEAEYTDANGLIPYNKLAIANGDIPQAKISGLSAALTDIAYIIVGAVEPVSPSVGDLWLDTSETPNRLKFYNGVEYLDASPESTLPAFTTSDANKVVMVNGTGTSLIFDDVDLSALVPKTYMGAANGVAPLDATGLIDESYLPEGLYGDFVYLNLGGAVANNTYLITRLFHRRIRITGISLQLSSGTCDVTIQVAGADVGATYGASSTPTDTTLGTYIEVDARSIGKNIGINVTNQSSADTLNVALAYTILD